MEFRWNDWNRGHIADHGIRTADAETVIRLARRPFPRYDGGGRYRVWGQDMGGVYLQVIFIYDPPGVIFVIHARPLNDREKRLYRRKHR